MKSAQMLVHHYLEISANQHPEKLAVVCDDAHWSYRQIDNCASGLASLLLDNDFVRQARVLIFLESSVESVLSVWGVLKAGGIFVILNPSLKSKKFEFILKDSGASVLITTRSLLKKVNSALSATVTLKQVVLCDPVPDSQVGVKNDEPRAYRIVHLWDTLSKEDEYQTPTGESPIETDLAALIYTSGSTGEPKGVMCAHYNMTAAVESITKYLENTPDDIVLNVLPLSFDYGLYQVLMTAAFGGTLILERGFGYSYPIIERIEQEQVTGFPIVPTIAALLLKMNGLDRNRLASLRYLTSTGDVLPVPVIARLRHMFPTVKIYSMYGLTECKRVSYLPPAEIDTKPSSVGIAIPNSEVLVLNENGEICLPGEIGELVVRGSTVTQGYWNDPELTSRVFLTGYHRDDTRLYSGDYFKTDADGYLYFVSRKDDLLKVKEERISPREIEDAILSAKGVLEAAVTVWIDRNYLKYLTAFVVSSTDVKLDAQYLLSHCQRHLEDHLLPRCFYFVQQLPKTVNGKVDRKALNKEFAARNCTAAVQI